jgi:hypothetical protein
MSHKRIWLQSGGEDPTDEATWCQDKINDDDVEYVLAEDYDNMLAKSLEIVVAWGKKLVEAQRRINFLQCECRRQEHEIIGHREQYDRLLESREELQRRYDAVMARTRDSALDRKGEHEGDQS